MMMVCLYVWNYFVVESHTSRLIHKKKIPIPIKSFLLIFLDIFNFYKRNDDGMSILSVVSKSPIFIEFCWSAQIRAFCSYGISK